MYRNLSYGWNFGVLSFICLALQIVTGLFLAMHYISDANLAFLSVEHIMRDINYGWFVRYIHANGASFFFLFVYLHVFRNIFYFSYTIPRWEIWVVGMIIFVLMILTAFLGYVLPWGQMSFWAATVITSLFSAIPIVGDFVVVWLWGGYAVEGVTLTRFYCLHFLLPFVLIFLVLIHILFLHIPGSTNPSGVFYKGDKIYFGPYYVLKDFFSIFIFLFFYFLFVFFFPILLGHSDNYIMANPVVTPAHIVPEWYFLLFYAILRSIPNKLGGILMLVSSLFVLFFLPFGNKSFNRSKLGYDLHKSLFAIFVIFCLLLGWLGGQPIDYPYIQLGQVFTFFYIVYLGIWFGFLEIFFTKDNFFFK